ncbi:MAG: translation elongation factor Ts [Candidatus Paceibacterota bacterium]|jgi:elongation factor Ts|nr:translation elongation factor Ts [Candidatus Paceibacterota bacterium]MDD4831168.1 translation elongation factor Ts [Candidatus Paceibacterota bacterium]MDD4875504.1 translation elongation factor Ts [Candidatus Paceibacterota bacterium]
MVTIEQIKQLREETGVSVTECKKALEEAKGDLEKAKEVLRVKGQSIAQKKGDRAANAGIITSYIHPGSQVGVLLDLRCETDFVARSEDFSALAHDICLQIAAANPLYASEKDIPEDVLSKEKEIALSQFKDSNKPADIINNIIEGKIGKYKQENVLLSQFWVKDSEKTMGDLVNEYIAKLGENILPKRFVRYELSNSSSNSSCN